MQIIPLFLLLLLLAAVVWFTGQPFGARRSRRLLAGDHDTSSLLAERDRVLDALQELDFDHMLGKVPAEDYPAQRAALLQKGAAILRQLDGLAAPSGTGMGEGRPAGEAIEQALAVRRAETAPGDSPDLSDDALESLIAARRAHRRDRCSGFCPRCGKPVLASDRFCPSCGTPIR